VQSGPIAPERSAKPLCVSSILTRASNPHQQVRHLQLLQRNAFPRLWGRRLAGLSENLPVRSRVDLRSVRSCSSHASTCLRVHARRTRIHKSHYRIEVLGLSLWSRFLSLNREGFGVSNDGSRGPIYCIGRFDGCAWQRNVHGSLVRSGKFTAYWAQKWA
jgi:hypothetical protein